MRCTRLQSWADANISAFWRLRASDAMGEDATVMKMTRMRKTCHVAEAKLCVFWNVKPRKKIKKIYQLLSPITLPPPPPPPLHSLIPPYYTYVTVRNDRIAIGQPPVCRGRGKIRVHSNNLLFTHPLSPRSPPSPHLSFESEIFPIVSARHFPEVDWGTTQINNFAFLSKRRRGRDNNAK